jgi:hypothetical protein
VGGKKRARKHSGGGLCMIKKGGFCGKSWKIYGFLKKIAFFCIFSVCSLCSGFVNCDVLH